LISTSSTNIPSFIGLLAEEVPEVEEEGLDFEPYPGLAAKMALSRSAARAAMTAGSSSSC
jgi:siroheme synthase